MPNDALRKGSGESTGKLSLCLFYLCAISVCSSLSVTRVRRDAYLKNLAICSNTS